MATPTYDLLDSTTLSSSASSVTFTSIDQSYRDLVLVVEVYSDTSTANPRIRVNGDSGSNYSVVFAFGDGSSATSFAGSADYINFSSSSATTTSAVLGIVDFLDYSATDKHKTQLGRSNKADGTTSMTATRWANTSAITSMEIYPFSNNFASGSTFHLYGIAS